MNKNLMLATVVLLAGCATPRNFPAVVDMPYSDANTTLPAVELVQIERTDSTTELTFMAMYDDYDTFFHIGDEVSLVANDFKAPLKEIKTIGNTSFQSSNDKLKGNLLLSQGVPSEFKLIFPALPEDVATVDFLQKSQGQIVNSIWGIDLSGKRSANEFPSDIPAELLKFDMSSGNFPQIVKKDGIVKITAHAVAWRDWMNPSVRFVVNTIDDKQEIIQSKFNKKGVVTVEIPVKGTTNISASTPYNTYSSFYVDPGEDINLYILPDHYSEGQRFIRPSGVGIIDGKYRNIMAMSHKLLFFHEYADTLLLDKTNPDEYFDAMMKIHSDALDSIQARNFPPDVAKMARAGADRMLMYHSSRPDAYTARDWDERDAAQSDSVLRFTPAQIEQIRSSIDFSNPLLELRTIGNPGNRTAYLKAKSLLLPD